MKDFFTRKDAPTAARDWGDLEKERANRQKSIDGIPQEIDHILTSWHASLAGHIAQTRHYRKPRIEEWKDSLYDSAQKIAKNCLDMPKHFPRKLQKIA